VANNWDIRYSNEARTDLLAIKDYIKQTLGSPINAQHQLDRILDEIDKLTIFPTRYQCYQAEPWHSKGLRVMPVVHYLIFYFPDNRTKTVKVIRIMYRKRDFSKQLPTEFK